MGIMKNLSLASFLHDHARPAWSGTIVRTTSFVCPSNIEMLIMQLSIAHANATGTWDTHIYLGTTSGGAELLIVGGLNGYTGFGSGTGNPYPMCGAWVAPVTPAMWGSTIYVTSSAPAGNYYLSGNIYVFGQ